MDMDDDYTTYFAVFVELSQGRAAPRLKGYLRPSTKFSMGENEDPEVYDCERYNKSREAKTSNLGPRRHFCSQLRMIMKLRMVMERRE
jgi:hypothetical protein